MFGHKIYGCEKCEVERGCDMPVEDQLSLLLITQFMLSIAIPC